MAKYLRVFETAADYKAAENQLQKPCVIYIKEDDSVVYKDAGDVVVDLNSQWVESTKTLDGYNVYMSDSKGQDNSKASIKITFKNQPNFKLYINSYAESLYDYTIAWKMDKEVPSGLVGYNDIGVKEHTRSMQKDPTSISAFKEVEYPNDGAKHFVWVTFTKDSSGSNYDDRGYVAIPNATSDDSDADDNSSVFIIKYGDNEYSFPYIENTKWSQYQSRTAVQGGLELIIVDIMGDGTIVDIYLSVTDTGKVLHIYDGSSSITGSEIIQPKTYIAK